MTKEEFYKLTDILNTEVLGNFMHGGEAEELIAMFEEAVERSNILEQEEPVSEDLEEAANEWDTKASFTPFYMTLDDNDSPNGVRQDYTTHAESFKAGAEWQKKKDSEFPKVWDRETLDDFAYQVAYDLSNDWMRETPTWDDVETAVKLGARWKDEHQ